MSKATLLDSSTNFLRPRGFLTEIQAHSCPEVTADSPQGAKRSILQLPTSFTLVYKSSTGHLRIAPCDRDDLLLSLAKLAAGSPVPGNTSSAAACPLSSPAVSAAVAAVPMGGARKSAATAAVHAAVMAAREPLRPRILAEDLWSATFAAEKGARTSRRKLQLQLNASLHVTRQEARLEGLKRLMGSWGVQHGEKLQLTLRPDGRLLLSRPASSGSAVESCDSTVRDDVVVLAAPTAVTAAASTEYQQQKESAVPDGELVQLQLAATGGDVGDGSDGSKGAQRLVLTPLRGKRAPAGNSPSPGRAVAADGSSGDTAVHRASVRQSNAGAVQSDVALVPPALRELAAQAAQIPATGFPRATAPFLGLLQPQLPMLPPVVTYLAPVRSGQRTSRRQERLSGVSLPSPLSAPAHLPIAAVPQSRPVVPQPTSEPLSVAAGERQVAESSPLLAMPDAAVGNVEPLQQQQHHHPQGLREEQLQAATTHERQLSVEGERVDHGTHLPGPHELTSREERSQVERSGLEGGRGSPQRVQKQPSPAGYPFEVMTTTMAMTTEMTMAMTTEMTMAMTTEMTMAMTSTECNNLDALRLSSSLSPEAAVEAAVELLTMTPSIDGDGPLKAREQLESGAVVEPQLPLTVQPVQALNGTQIAAVEAPLRRALLLHKLPVVDAAVAAVAAAASAPFEPCLDVADQHLSLTAMCTEPWQLESQWQRELQLPPPRSVLMSAPGMGAALADQLTASHTAQQSPPMAPGADRPPLTGGGATPSPVPLPQVAASGASAAAAADLIQGLVLHALQGASEGSQPSGRHHPQTIPVGQFTAREEEEEEEAQIAAGQSAASEEASALATAATRPVEGRQLVVEGRQLVGSEESFPVADPAPPCLAQQQTEQCTGGTREPVPALEPGCSSAHIMESIPPPLASHNSSFQYERRLPPQQQPQASSLLTWSSLGEQPPLEPAAAPPVKFILAEQEAAAGGLAPAWETSSGCSLPPLPPLSPTRLQRASEDLSPPLVEVEVLLTLKQLSPPGQLIKVPEHCRGGRPPRAPSLCGGFRSVKRPRLAASDACWVLGHQGYDSCNDTGGDGDDDDDEEWVPTGSAAADAVALRSRSGRPLKKRPWVLEQQQEQQQRQQWQQQQQQQAVASRRSTSEERFRLLAKHMPEGYRWRKYGEKFIDGRSRAYFRCTYRGCPAKVRAEWRPICAGAFGSSGGDADGSSGDGGGDNVNERIVPPHALWIAHEAHHNHEPCAPLPDNGAREVAPWQDEVGQQRQEPEQQQEQKQQQEQQQEQEQEQRHTKEGQLEEEHLRDPQLQLGGGVVRTSSSSSGGGGGGSEAVATVAPDGPPSTCQDVLGQFLNGIVVDGDAALWDLDDYVFPMNPPHHHFDTDLYGAAEGETLMYGSAVPAEVEPGCWDVELADAEGSRASEVWGVALADSSAVQGRMNGMVTMRGEDTAGTSGCCGMCEELLVGDLWEAIAGHLYSQHRGKSAQDECGCGAGPGPGRQCNREGSHACDTAPCGSGNGGGPISDNYVWGIPDGDPLSMMTSWGSGLVTGQLLPPMDQPVGLLSCPSYSHVEAIVEAVAMDCCMGCRGA